MTRSARARTSALTFGLRIVLLGTLAQLVEHAPGHPDLGVDELTVDRGPAPSSTSMIRRGYGTTYGLGGCWFLDGSHPSAHPRTGGTPTSTRRCWLVRLGGGGVGM